VALAGTGGDELFGGYKSFAGTAAGWACARAGDAPAVDGTGRGFMTPRRLRDGAFGRHPDSDAMGQVAECVEHGRADAQTCTRTAYACSRERLSARPFIQRPASVRSGPFRVRPRNSRAYRRQHPDLSAISALEL